MEKGRFGQMSSLDGNILSGHLPVIAKSKAPCVVKATHLNLLKR